MTGSPVPRGISAAVPAVATHAVETFREVCWPLGEGIREFQGGLGREPSVASGLSLPGRSQSSHPSCPPRPSPKPPHLSWGPGARTGVERTRGRQ